MKLCELYDRREMLLIRVSNNHLVSLNELLNIERKIGAMEAGVPHSECYALGGRGCKRETMETVCH